MASVPSAGCLLAKNQFYRVRMNSESSDSSIGSDVGLSTDYEKSTQGTTADLNRKRYRGYEPLQRC